MLHAAWGEAWETEVNKKAAAYAANDNLVHLVGPDQPDLLGYLDFGLLLKLLEDNWTIFEPFLLQRVVWNGRAVEMCSIRNRVGHVRRAGDFQQIYGLTETSRCSHNRTRPEDLALPVAERAKRLSRAGAPTLGARLQISDSERWLGAPLLGSAVALSACTTRT